MKAIKSIITKWKASREKSRKLQALAWELYEIGLSDQKPPFKKPNK